VSTPTRSTTSAAAFPATLRARVTLPGSSSNSAAPAMTSESAMLVFMVITPAADHPAAMPATHATR